MHSRFFASGKTTDMAFLNASSLSVKKTFGLIPKQFLKLSKALMYSCSSSLEMSMKHALNDILNQFTLTK